MIQNFDERKVQIESQREQDLKKRKPLTPEHKKKMKDARRKNAICGHCGMNGHFSTECDTHRCSHPMCTERSDHLAKDCPNVPKHERKEYFRRKGDNKNEILRGNKINNARDEVQVAAYLRNILEESLKSPKYGKTIKEMGKLDTHNDDLHYTSTRCIANIDGKDVNAIIDSGAAVCAITQKLLEDLDMDIEEKSNINVRTADGKTHRSLGKIRNKFFLLEGIKTQATLEVIESKDDKLIILGTNWNKDNRAKIDFDNETLTFEAYNGQSNTIPIEFMYKEQDSDEEYEDEDLREVRF